MGKILWIIGAGASKHLGVPLLKDFRSFFQEIWDKFPENRTDPELISVLPSVMRTMDTHAGQDIEQLLLPSSPLTEPDRNMLKKAIRRTFELRQLGSFAKRIPSYTKGIEHKFDAYARLICCMDDGDAIVTFNYDNAFEYVLSCLSSNFDLLNVSELSSYQLSELQRLGCNLWIPQDCQNKLRLRRIRYCPASSFAAEVPTFGLGNKSIDLIKIHGSINWFESENNRIHVGVPTKVSRTPLIAYPEPSKPETKLPPFNLVMNEAIYSIQRFDIIVIIGYSFPLSDSVGHPFVEQLTQKLCGKSVIAVDPFPGEGLRKALNNAGSTLIADEYFERSFSSSKFEGLNFSDYIATMRQNRN